MDSEVLNRRMLVNPSRITGQFTTIEDIDLQGNVDDQIEAVRARYGSVNDDNTIKDLSAIDCYSFFTDTDGHFKCCITLHLVRVVNVHDGQPWSDYT